MKIRLQSALLVLFVFLAASCTKESTEDTNIPISANAVLVEQQVLEIINDHRISIGQKPLDYSSVAYRYANDHNDYMIAKGSINHDHFNVRASAISQQTQAESVAENIARNYDTAEEAYENWMQSASHRETLEGDFTHTAVSVKMDSAGNYYFTQLFYR